MTNTMRAAAAVLRVAGMSRAKPGEAPQGQRNESGNLTTAPSGIPHYAEELFLQVMRTGT